MKATNLKQIKPSRSPRWFQRRRRWHDPMLVLNMFATANPSVGGSIFNSDRRWDGILNFTRWMKLQTFPKSDSLNWRNK